MSYFLEYSALNVTLNLLQSLSQHGKYLPIQIYDSHKSLINQIILWYQKMSKEKQGTQILKCRSLVKAICWKNKLQISGAALPNSNNNSFLSLAVPPSPVPRSPCTLSPWLILRFTV